MKQVIANPKGFSLVTISLMMLPLLLCCMVILSSYFLISKYTDTQRECRSNILKTQQILGQKLKELLDLNPKATALRAEEKRLRLAIAAAGIPALKILLNLNIAQQGMLRAQQEQILLSAKSQAKSAIGKYASQFSMIRSSQVNHSSIELKVYKAPPTAIAPDHLTMPMFTDVQNIKVNWKVPTDYFIPKFLLDFFPNYPARIEGKCAATLIQKGNVWNPKLHLAKF